MTLFMIDAMMVILLLFGLRSVMKLHEEMREYKTIKNDLTSILRTLQSNMKTAEKTIHAMQEGIKYASAHITPHLPKANILKDDLAFLLENGEKTADRLENLTREIKKSYLTPQTVVFDPEQSLSQAINPNRSQMNDSQSPPVTEKNASSPKQEPVFTMDREDPDQEATHKGFFTSIRRVR